MNEREKIRRLRAIYYNRPLNDPSRRVARSTHMGYRARPEHVPFLGGETPEAAIERARNAYVMGNIDVGEFEVRVERALS